MKKQERQEKLEEILESAKAILYELDVPTALSVNVQWDARAGRKVVAECEETDEGCLIRVFHWTSQEDLLCTLLHELIHTGGLWEHDEEFMAVARKIKQATGYNVMSAVCRDDVKLKDAEVKHRLVCENCGAELLFYTEESFEKYKSLKIYCAYCKQNNFRFI